MSFGRVVAFQVLAVLAGVAGCTKTNPLDCSDGSCSDTAHPYCDKDGAVAGEPNTCIAVSCSAPNVFVDCKGDTALSCNAAGDGYTLTPCSMGCSAAAHGCNMCTPNGTYCTSAGVQACGSDGAPTTFEACAEGCVADPQPHCAHLVPRYLANVCDTAATADLDISASATLGTDLDTSCTGGIVTQTAAPDICVVRNKTITIESGVTLKATGGRLLAFVADDNLAIHGVLDASADGTTSGPGGGSQTSGGARGGKQGPGGGGAGFKTAGAAGASITTDGGGANGGAAEPDPAQLAVMIGGSRNEGGGGGGVILVACRGAVTVDGVVDVGGGGGPGGLNPTGVNPICGGGGGAGGYLVAQGWAVAITGKAYANGGGGGAGNANVAAMAGADGSRSSTVGASGGAASGSEGPGGAGACKGTQAGVGHPPSNGALGAAGGGGGGLGYLQTYTPSGVAPTITPMDASPDFQTNLTVQTQ